MGTTKFLRVLKNQNQIHSETVQKGVYPEEVSNFSIKTVFSGNQIFNIGKRQLDVYPESFLAIKEGTIHSSRIDSSVPVKNLSISFSPKFLSDFHRLQTSKSAQLLDEPFEGSVYSDFSFIETIYPFTGDMRYNLMHLRERLEDDTTDDLLLNEYLHHCLINYYKVYYKEVVNKSEKLTFLNNSTKVEVLKRLTLAKEFIICNYNRPIDLEDIAGQACLSVNHLLRTFKQAYGQSPHQFLTKVRIERSKYLLTNTTSTINEIVETIGFECPSSFIRLFKNVTNLTPGQYRMNR